MREQNSLSIHSLGFVEVELACPFGKRAYLRSSHGGSRRFGL